MRIVYAGTPDFAVPPLTALLGSRHEVVGVLTQPDRPKGRGRQIAASPVKQVAQSHGIAVSQPLALKTDADRAALADWRPDVLVVVAYGLILPRAVLDLPRLGCVNIHASLLPRWRGAAPIQRAILAGDQETGVSIMLMEAGLDTGPVLLERKVLIDPSDTAATLHERLAQIGAPALLQALDGLEDGSSRASPQSVSGMTYAAKIDKSEATIDWKRSAEDIARQVRAFNPWPVAEGRLQGEPLRIYGAQVLSGPAGQPAGTITSVEGGNVVVSCGSQSLGLTEVQRPGRRRIAAADFANTQNLVGLRFD